MSNKGKKEPRSAVAPSPSKTPIARKDPGSFYGLPPSWQIGKIDFGGAWGCHHIDSKEILSKVLTRMKAFESMTWADIERPSRHGGGHQNHEMHSEKISKDARKRLADIGLDDIDTLYSLCVTGKERIWGIRGPGGVFQILWWDPEHTVYPTSKK